MNILYKVNFEKLSNNIYRSGGGMEEPAQIISLKEWAKDNPNKPPKANNLAEKIRFVIFNILGKKEMLATKEGELKWIKSILRNLAGFVIYYSQKDFNYPSNYLGELKNYLDKKLIHSGLKEVSRFEDYSEKCAEYGLTELFPGDEKRVQYEASFYVIDISSPNIYNEKFIKIYDKEAGKMILTSKVESNIIDTGRSLSNQFLVSFHEL